MGRTLWYLNSTVELQLNVLAKSDDSALKHCSDADCEHNYLNLRSRFGYQTQYRAAFTGTVYKLQATLAMSRTIANARPQPELIFEFMRPRHFRWENIARPTAEKFNL